MCGIAGVLAADRSIAIGAAARIAIAESHRGPDATGSTVLPFGGQWLAVAQRRLAIQDLSPAAHQPMVHVPTGNVIVYNGELYNTRELRTSLAANGAKFRGHGDTEVLLEAYARWGIDCLPRLYGMFAFGIFDQTRTRLILARDPLGIKPLCFAESPVAFVFASEVRALLRSELVDRTLDRLTVASILAYGAVPCPLTMFASVRQVEPGSFTTLEVKDGAPVRSAMRRHWTMPSAPARESRPGEVSGLLREPLEAAVRSHLIGDVRVGVCLSGGIDSTAIAVLAARAHGRPIDTFTVRLDDDPAIDESRLAARTARSLGANHREVVVRESEALAASQRFFASMDHPSVDGLNTFVIAKAVREAGVKVALSGLGGDELFGGYRAFRRAPWVSRMNRVTRTAPDGWPRLAVRMALSRRPAYLQEKATDFVDCGESVAAATLTARRLFSNDALAAFGLDYPGWRAAQYLPEEASPLTSEVAGDAWATVRAVETKFYLGNMLLPDSDCFSMAHGLEMRLPLLDRRILDVAFSFTCPTPIGLTPRVNKPWLVRAMGRDLSPQLVGRRKRGFSLPQARWMAGPLKDEFHERLRYLATSGIIEPRMIFPTWEAFLEAPAATIWTRVWMLAALGAWLRASASW